MIFQHTLDDVLTGRKTQTSRIWKHYYRLGNEDIVYGDSHQKSPNVQKMFFTLWLLNTNTPRKVYEVGKTYAVQAKRGGHGLARIRIKSLAKRDIRDFDDDDIEREGFWGFEQFYDLWCEMHDNNYEALVINFELIKQEGGE